MAKSIRTAIIAAAMTLLLALGAAATGLTAHAADQPQQLPVLPLMRRISRPRQNQRLTKPSRSQTASRLQTMPSSPLNK